MKLDFFHNTSILESARQFFSTVLDISIAPASKSEINISEFLKEQVSDSHLLGKVKDARFLGMINTLSLDGKTESQDAEIVLKQPSDDYDMLLVFGIELSENIIPTKTDISRLTRALNRRSFSRPVVLVLKYGSYISFSSAERGQYKRIGKPGEKIGRISILRNINTNQVHAGHERILLQLRINPLKINTFNELYAQWLEVFNVSILNKEFYNELFTWYLWAVRTVSFPNWVDDKSDDTVYNSENVIRLLTRLIFIWFVKEKGLVPEALFEKSKISESIKSFNPNAEDNSDYYKAILQNLFFATLNTEMPKDGGCRAYIDNKKKNKNTGYTEEYMDHLVFRYKNLFANPEEGLRLFENIPFLNGGLFECLDRRDPETDMEFRIDGFSSTPSKQPVVPNVLFFGRNDDLDLSNEFENSIKHKHSKARGIINILNSYKFTIEENTPLEQEIALDPELLGKIFENLLASYNPETRTTARKQTGSYYTPREIVNYMVDESLISYLKTKLTDKTNAFQQLGSQQTNIFGNEGKTGQLDMQIDLAASKWDRKEYELEKQLRKLFAYESEENPFNDDTTTTKAIIAHLSECKILDPACGSGAFPMGILHKMVLALGKLDPCNYTWKQAQLEKAQRDKHRAQQFEDETLRNDALKSAEDKISYIEASFGETGHELDYARKLFLIENCIYGVDIQQIAVQISKLRFFISLMVDQRVDDHRPNRNIISLPNLETKFVAANTLIPVDKPQQLTFKDPAVELTEKELHEIHQKIFFTRSYSDKKKLKNKELQTRHSLRKLYVEKAGYSKEAAEKITQWNPFDPLKAAPFFDPEVMFTIDKDTQGGYFDVVIGNPPYVSALELKKLIAPDLHSKLKEIFKSAKGTVDLFIYFFEKGIILNKMGGVLTFISPNRYLSASYGEALREFIYNNSQILNIVDLSHVRVFEQASTYPIISILSKLKGHKYKIRIGKFNEKNNSIDSKIVASDKLNFFDGYVWGYLLNEKFEITEKVINQSVPLISVCKINATSTASEADQYHNLINEKSGYKLINTGTIDKYFTLWGTQPLTDKKTHFLKPYLPKNSSLISDNRNLLYGSEKIILAKIALSAEAYLDKIGEYASINTNCLHSFHINIDSKFILAWVNSKLFQYIFECFFDGLKMQGGYLLYSAPNLSKMFIKIPDSHVQSVFIDIVNSLLSCELDSEKYYTHLDFIDLMFYKLYSLSYDECKIVHFDIAKLITREDYEKTSIEELADYGIKTN